MNTPLLSVAVLSKTPSHQYLLEILDHAGFVYRLAPEEEGPTGMRKAPLWVVLAHGRNPLDSTWTAALESHWKAGGGLVLIGPPLGLEDAVGIRLEMGYNADRPEWLGSACGLGNGHAIPGNHPITSSAPRPLPVFGGWRASHQPGAEVIASFRNSCGERTPCCAGVVRPRGGSQGPLVCWLADLVRSVHHIQHGIPVVRDGVPAPDGSAPVDDDILKAEDGLVLDWRFDRSFDMEAGFSYFDVPLADHLRQWLVNSILWCAREADVRLPRLNPLPRGVKAIAHISLDTDNNDPALARSMLARLAEQEVRATWCHITPGYPKTERIADRLKAEGHEIAFHFNAGCEPGKPWAWNQDSFGKQYAEIQEATGWEEICTNKNHFTRWEGCTEFFEWCVRAGIQIDSTKGASKPGTIGFPFGSSFPWFPHDRDGNRIDCLELCFLTQDPVVTVPPAVTSRFHQAVADVGGISHFLFHPAHIEKPGVADALAGVIRQGRERGAEWWTACEISRWERKRRQALASARQGQPQSEDSQLEWL